MTDYGTETETTYLDADKSTIDIIRKYKDSEIMRQFKRVSLRIKVLDKRDETTQYLLFSDLIEEKRQLGLLIVRDNDPTTRPSFTVEFPNTNDQGYYFIIRSHTELMA